MKQIHPIRAIEPTSKRTSTIKSIIDNNIDVIVNTLLPKLVINCKVPWHENVCDPL